MCINHPMANCEAVLDWLCKTLLMSRSKSDGAGSLSGGIVSFSPFGGSFLSLFGWGEGEEVVATWGAPPTAARLAMGAARRNTGIVSMKYYSSMKLNCEFSRGWENINQSEINNS